jgi:hypothetical protein
MRFPRTISTHVLRQRTPEAFATALRQWELQLASVRVRATMRSRCGWQQIKLLAKDWA